MKTFKQQAVGFLKKNSFNVFFLNLTPLKRIKSTQVNIEN